MRVKEAGAPVANGVLLERVAFLSVQALPTASQVTNSQNGRGPFAGSPPETVANDPRGTVRDYIFRVRGRVGLVKSCAGELPVLLTPFARRAQTLPR